MQWGFAAQEFYKPVAALTLNCEKTRTDTSRLQIIVLTFLLHYF